MKKHIIDKKFFLKVIFEKDIIMKIKH